MKCSKIIKSVYKPVLFIAVDDSRICGKDVFRSVL